MLPLETCLLYNKTRPAAAQAAAGQTRPEAAQGFLRTGRLDLEFNVEQTYQEASQPAVGQTSRKAAHKLL